jgi:threonine dehydrogenase-like Zn-dependent dehydrogenase
MNLPKTMQALRLQEVGRLELVELPVPKPGPNEVLVKTSATTICTSDLNDIAGNVLGMQLTLVMGHEGAGRVAVVGEQVRGLVVGQPVAAHRVVPCRRCEHCLRGLGHLCLQIRHLGYNIDGTFAEFFVLRADRLRLVPDGLDMAVAALMEPVCVCLEALRRARFSRGETLLVVGDGPFGLLTARLALEQGKRGQSPFVRSTLRAVPANGDCPLFPRGPGKLILVGRHDFRMGHVPEAVAIHEKRVASVVGSVLQETGGLGVDVAIVCASSQTAMDQCVASVRARGRVVVFSTIPGRPTVDLFRVQLKELEILGSCNDEDELDRAMACLANRELRLDQLVTHRLPLEQWPRALELASQAREQALKVAFVFEDSA